MYEIKGKVEYNVNTKCRSREIAKQILTVMDNPNHEDREYLLSQAINKILYGVNGEYLLKEDITVIDFLLHHTEVGQVCHILDNGYNCCMVEVDDEDIFRLPSGVGNSIIKGINYDYDHRVNELPLITIRV